eukprot:15471229-Alexandrium_andersonii.AAC.1
MSAPFLAAVEAVEAASGVAEADEDVDGLGARPAVRSCSSFLEAVQATEAVEKEAAADRRRLGHTARWWSVGVVASFVAGAAFGLGRARCARPSPSQPA